MFKIGTWWDYFNHNWNTNSLHMISIIILETILKLALPHLFPQCYETLWPLSWLTTLSPHIALQWKHISTIICLIKHNLTVCPTVVQGNKKCEHQSSMLLVLCKDTALMTRCPLQRALIQKTFPWCHKIRSAVMLTKMLNIIIWYLYTMGH